MRKAARSRSRYQSRPSIKNPAWSRFESPNRDQALSSLDSFAALYIKLHGSYANVAVHVPQAMGIETQYVADVWMDPFGSASTRRECYEITTNDDSMGGSGGGYRNGGRGCGKQGFRRAASVGG